MAVPAAERNEANATTQRRRRFNMHTALLRPLVVVLTVSCLTAPAPAEQKPPPRRSTITLPSLAAQGFEIKAAIGSNLVLQKGKDVWLCYMLDTRSMCQPAD